MTKTIVVERVLSLLMNEIKTLQDGKTIAALPISQVQKGWNFLLHPYPCDGFASDARIECWATCENFRIIHDARDLPILAALSLWSQSSLEKLFKERGHLSLALLRAYTLPDPIVVSSEMTSGIKLGKFVGLSHLGEVFKESLQVTEILPVLSDSVYANRHQQLTNFRLPEHRELEAIQSTIEHYAQTNSEAKSLDYDLRVFLGWADAQKIASTPDWIREITTTGNSSDGDLFEKRVRQAFIHLGFTNNRLDPKVSLNPGASGGSGGLDFYCEFPYPIVGECKASKDLKVNDNKDGAPSQLIKLGHKLLTPEEFSCAIKIIMAPGELTKDSKKTAIGNHMNIIRPETLERLVNLKNSHSGSIDLLKLKPYLEKGPFGVDADERLNEFIEETSKLVEIRSHIVKTFKEYLEKKKVTEAGIEKFSGFFCGSDSPQQLEDRELHEILIELSSPLTGYLGRTKGNSWKDDRFYYLRDLILPNSQI
jgi:hypothetical protein